MDWTLSAAHLDLEDLLPLLDKPAVNATTSKSEKTPFGTASARVDHLLKEGAIHLQLRADDISYKGFFSGPCR